MKNRFVFYYVLWLLLKMGNSLTDFKHVMINDNFADFKQTNIGSYFVDFEQTLQDSNKQRLVAILQTVNLCLFC